MALISIVLPDLCGGGAERVSVDLAHAFKAAGHQVEFVLMQATGDFLPEVQRNFTIHDLATPRMRQTFGPIAAYLRRRKPDAVLAMMWPLTCVVPLAAALPGSSARVLVVEHGMLSRQYASRGRLHRAALCASTALGYRLADARAGVSPGLAADMAQLSGIAPEKVATLYNPVRALHPASADARRMAEALWGGAGPRILTVGALKRVKNHGLLLRAFARMSRADARLMLVGQGQEEAALRALGAELGITDRVIFAGFHADPVPFYETADLFALSSDSEGFGNVLVEALACGLPVVSTDCPSGPAAILDNGRWGRLTPVEDADALARAMDETLANPPDRESLKRRALDFSPEIAAGAYLRLLGLDGGGSAG